MLVLSRRIDESIVIDSNIELKILGWQGEKVKIGIIAPPETKVKRKETIGVPDEVSERTPTESEPTRRLL